MMFAQSGHAATFTAARLGRYWHSPDPRDATVCQPGNDALCGDSGNDTLDGGPGNDKCDGGSGTDTASNCETKTTIP